MTFAQWLLTHKGLAAVAAAGLISGILGACTWALCTDVWCTLAVFLVIFVPLMRMYYIWRGTVKCPDYMM